MHNRGMNVGPDRSSPTPSPGMRHRTRGTSLPAALTHLVGRERELALTDHLLRREDVRLLTVTGPGGIGKTRLAIEIARNMAPAWPDSVVFVPLAVVFDTGGVIAAIMRALGLPDPIDVAAADG